MRLFHLATALMLAAPALAQAQAQTPVTVADYDRAAQLIEPNLAAHIFDNRIRYHWIDGGKALWYETNDRKGPRFMRVEVATGAVTRLAEAPKDPSAAAPADEMASPDGRLALFRRADNLWLRDRAGGKERALTSDGEPFYSYAKLFDDSTHTIDSVRLGLKLPPYNNFWSPDGRLILGHRNDERALLPYPYVESVPRDGSSRPILREIRMTLLGEPGRIVIDPYVIDVASGRKVTVAMPKGWQIDSAPVAWSPDCAKAFVLATQDDKHGSGLFEIDTATGAVRAVVTERSETSSAAYFFNVFEYNYPNVRVVGGGRQAIWFSQRDGRAHLYLYDVASGKLIRALTPGHGVVLDIIGIDERRRQVFATMAGVDPSRDPYQRDLYAIPLDGGAARRLTPGAADHEITAPYAPFWAGIITARADTSPVSPDGAAFVDIASTLDTPTITTLRSTVDGHVIAALERADASEARSLGWRPPTRFTVKAADGKTDLWGAIYLPPDYDPAKRYPVIDSLYGGPQLIVAPRNFNEAGALTTLILRHTLASLGFVVVTVDGRGTPGRDRAFWQAGYGNFADVGIDDHVAAIRKVAKTYRGMDLDRVGVTGHSFGGYVAARAMLRYPDFYKVGTSSAAVHNWQGFRDAYEQYQGTVDYGGGARIKPRPDAVPDHYRTLDNDALAPRLKGKLLIAYADLDENAMPSSTLQFVDALTKANRDYDLLYMANGNHGFGIQPYFVRRQLDYFVTHLAGRQPPAGYDLKIAPWKR